MKFYIKGKQEKRVYLTPRQRERDRLELIDEVLIFSPYIPPIPIFDIQTPDVCTFDCKASELQPSFLINTLGKACQNQRVAPDKTTQIADDLTRFYEEIFIPEGGVPQLQHNPMEHHFLWVCAEFDRENIMLYYSRIILVLASSNGSKPGSEPTVHIMWSINTTSSNAVDLVEFEHFYDEKADGFKRNAKSLSSDAGIRLEKWRSGTRDWRLNRTRAPGNINLTQEGGSITQPKKDQVAEVLEAQEELVQRDMVDDTLGKKKVVEGEGSAGGKSDQAVESGVDEFDVMELEEKKKKLPLEPVDKFNGTGVIDLEATKAKTEPIVRPKMDKFQSQKDRKPGRKGCKPRSSKAKVEPLTEGLPEIVPSDNEAPPQCSTSGG